MPRPDADTGEATTARLRSFYALEQAQDPSLDAPEIADYRTSVLALRAAGELPEPGLQNFDAWQEQLTGGRFTVAPAEATSTTTVRPSTDFAPGERLRSTGGNARGAGQVFGGALGSLLPFPMSMVTAPAAEDFLGRAGEGLQARYERATGQPPSVAGTDAERMQAAGIGPFGAILGGGLQAVPLLGSVLRATGGRAAAGQAVRTAGKAAEEALLDRAEAIGPGIRDIAARTRGLADEGFDFFNPRGGRIMPAAEVAKTLEPLATNAPIETVLQTVAKPDISRTLLAVAETDSERALAQEAITLAQRIGTAGEQAATPTAAASSKLVGKLTRAFVAGIVGHHVGGTVTAAAAAALEPVVETMLRNMVNRAASSTPGRVLLGATADTLSAVPPVGAFLMPSVPDRIGRR